MSDANRATRASIATRTLGALLLFTLAACSTVPDWSEQESREFAITAHYTGGDEPRTVPLPSSTRHLLILELAVRPGALRETFSDSSRLMVLPAGADRLQLDCRYRLYRRHAPDGSPLPWPEPGELFPGAAQIDHHD